MFTLLCKLFHTLQQKPGWTFGAACLATVLALFPLKDFEVKATASELLPNDWESVKAWKSFGRKFGSAGHLAVIVHSPNAKLNLIAVENLAAHLESHPGVNFLEYRTEAEFYRKHQLLYISLNDLREVEKRVETGFWVNRTKRNPLIQDLLSEEEKDSAFDATSFEDLEAKYFSRIKDLYGSPDSTTLVLRIYPSFDVTDVHACRAFLLDVQTAAESIPEGPEIFYAGDVARVIQNEGRLFSKILGTTRIALVLAGFLLLLYFIRLPVGAMLALIPTGMAIIWSLALTRLWIGSLGMVTAPLSLLMVGLGLSGSIHLLSRYAEERRKRLSAPVAFETIILETGPAIAAGLLTLAVAFLTFRLTDFRALGDFGLVAGIGMLCAVVAVLLVFPSLLRLAEPFGILNPFGPRVYNQSRQPTWSFRPARVFLVTALFLTAALMIQGPQLRFQLDFSALGFRDSDHRAENLLAMAGEEIPSPAVFLSRDASTANQIAEELRYRRARSGGNSAIGEITTLHDLYPADQEEKLRIISRLRRSVTPEVIAGAKEPLRSNLEKLSMNWPTRPLRLGDLPMSYRKKFLGREETPGVFTYVLPAQDSLEGFNSLRFAREIHGVRLPDGISAQAGGWPVVYGDLIAHMVPDARKALGFALGAILIILILTVGSLPGALALFLPVLCTLIWLLGAMKLLHMKINPYNLVALPLAAAYATIHALHFYHRYEEEGRGSLPMVFRRTGRSALVATIVASAAFVPMLFTGHRGMASLGVSAILGLVFALIAPVLLIGGVLGMWEENKVRRERALPQPSESEKTSK